MNSKHNKLKQFANKLPKIYDITSQEVIDDIPLNNFHVSKKMIAHKLNLEKIEKEEELIYINATNYLGNR